MQRRQGVMVERMNMLDRGMSRTRLLEDGIGRTFSSRLFNLRREPCYYCFRLLLLFYPTVFDSEGLPWRCQTFTRYCFLNPSCSEERRKSRGDAADGNETNPPYIAAAVTSEH